MSLDYLCTYGAVTLPDTTPTGAVPDDFTLNSPVGVHADHYGNVWVCDTGNSRVLVFTPDLQTLLHVIEGPGKKTSQAPRFLMPFHVCPHPDEDRMYITDMGHGRVVVFDYGKNTVSFHAAFGDVAKPGYLPLSDPNGLTIVRERDGEQYLYVCDEFFHTPGDLSSRCVKFTLDGKFVTQFRGVRSAKAEHQLLWPQGLASDSKGNLYLANTGHYEVLKISTEWPIEDGQVVAPAGTNTVLLHSFGNPLGIGKFNVMRSVCVINDRVFVPGHVENTISVYSPSGKLEATVSGLVPLWNHSMEPVHSLSDLAYSALEDVVFVGPYQLCAGAGDDEYFITEPFASSVIKVRIPQISGGQEEDALLLESVGHRRDDQERLRGTSQFNCMTAVIEVDPVRKGVAPAAAGGNWFDQWATAATRVYQYWYDYYRKHSGIDPMKRVGRASLNIDSGNWCLKTFSTASDPYHQMQELMRGFFVPGDLAMDVYYPAVPPLGQICPGTPLLFVTNFNACTVSMYQFSPAGYLINYGVPFGREGIGGEGTLKAPQGIAVNSRGEIYIADSMNNRLSMWQIQASGFVTFRKNFRWEQDGKEFKDFTPCDIAIDAQDRLYVCDQFNNCLRVFDREGKSLWSYGRLGYCDDVDTDYENFMLPASVCIDGDCLIVNDLVNRALKVFRIGEDTLHYVTGASVFKKYPEQGGVWMPYFIHAGQGRLYVPDTTFNVVNVFTYGEQQALAARKAA